MPASIRAWWLRYPGKQDRAAKHLKDYAKAIESKARWLDRHYPGIDWLPLLYYSAYKAAFMCDSDYVWPIMKKCLYWAASNGIRTYKRRTEKLSRVPLDEEKLLYDRHMNA